MPQSDEIWKAYQDYYTHDDSKTNILPFLRPLEQAYIAKKFGYPSQESGWKKLLSGLIYLFPTERAEIDIRVFYLYSSYGKKMLDIGCGDGSLIQRLSKKGWDVQGIDFDEKAVAHCKSKGLNVQAGDLISQKFPAASFDVITWNHVIEHVFNPKEVIAECYRILKPGGRLVIATPNTKSWIYNKVFKAHWFSLDPPRHVILYNRKSLCNLLKECTFEIEKAETTIRNEFYVYVGSRAIKEKGHFAMGKEKPNKVHLIYGKIYQFISWFMLAINKDSGGEVLVKAIKK
jgi:2-polyprenyl-3-methyl-5-hydroxy-6-metoxy-1,4-benzoquinol methylase